MVESSRITIIRYNYAIQLHYRVHSCRAVSSFLVVKVISSKCWPLVYAVDMACDVVAHVQVRDSKLATAVWGDSRGCFQKLNKRATPEVYM